MEILQLMLEYKFLKLMLTLAGAFITAIGVLMLDVSKDNKLFKSVSGAFIVIGMFMMIFFY